MDRIVISPEDWTCLQDNIFRTNFYMPVNEGCSTWWMCVSKLPDRVQVSINQQIVGEFAPQDAPLEIDVTAFVFLEDNELVLQVDGSIPVDVLLIPYPCEA